MSKLDDSAQEKAFVLFDALSAVKCQLDAGTPVDKAAVEAALAFATAPMTEPERIAIDDAMQADKLADGYGQRNQQRAMRLQMSDPRPQTSSGLWA